MFKRSSEQYPPGKLVSHMSTKFNIEFYNCNCIPCRWCRRGNRGRKRFQECQLQKQKKLMGRGNEMQKCCSNPVELYEIAS